MLTLSFSRIRGCVLHVRLEPHFMKQDMAVGILSLLVVLVALFERRINWCDKYLANNLHSTNNTHDRNRVLGLVEIPLGLHCIPCAFFAFRGRSLFSPATN